MTRRRAAFIAFSIVAIGYGIRLVSPRPVDGQEVSMAAYLLLFLAFTFLGPRRNKIESAVFSTLYAAFVLVVAEYLGRLLLLKGAAPPVFAHDHSLTLPGIRLPTWALLALVITALDIVYQRGRAVPIAERVETAGS